jgi:hypothetical protein
MTYKKPEVLTLGDATATILCNSSKSGSPTDGCSSPNQGSQSPPAYDLDN